MLLRICLLLTSHYQKIKLNKGVAVREIKGYSLTLSPLTLYTAILTFFIFIVITHELLTNVPSNHICLSSTLNKEYFT